MTGNLNVKFYTVIGIFTAAALAVVGTRKVAKLTLLSAIPYRDLPNSSADFI
jgi:hypothetical protein